MKNGSSTPKIPPTANLPITSLPPPPKFGFFECRLKWKICINHYKKGKMDLALQKHILEQNSNY